jgi:hypothetical protein
MIRTFLPRSGQTAPQFFGEFQTLSQSRESETPRIGGADAFRLCRPFQTDCGWMLLGELRDGELVGKQLSLPRVRRPEGHMGNSWSALL